MTLLFLRSSWVLYHESCVTLHNQIEIINTLFLHLSLHDYKSRCGILFAILGRLIQHEDIHFIFIEFTLVACIMMIIMMMKQN